MIERMGNIFKKMKQASTRRREDEEEKNESEQEKAKDWGIPPIDRLQLPPLSPQSHHHSFVSSREYHDHQDDVTSIK